jgi:hypothetical protein
MGAHKGPSGNEPRHDALPNRKTPSVFARIHERTFPLSPGPHRQQVALFFPANTSALYTLTLALTLREATLTLPLTLTLEMSDKTQK